MYTLYYSLYSILYGNNSTNILLLVSFFVVVVLFEKNWIMSWNRCKASDSYSLNKTLRWKMIGTSKILWFPFDDECIQFSNCIIYATILLYKWWNSNVRHLVKKLTGLYWSTICVVHNFAPPFDIDLFGCFDLPRFNM